MLKPLEQWLCDTCRGLIANPDDGWLEWINEDDHLHSFKIVHHAKASPRQPNGDCYQHTKNPGRMDMHLDVFLPPDGMAILLSFLDLGPLHDPDGARVPRVKDIREFTELLRRLTIPYYEEARLYWSDAIADGYFEGANEVWPYLPESLKGLIESYGQEV